MNDMQQYQIDDAKMKAVLIARNWAAEAVAAMVAAERNLTGAVECLVRADQEWEKSGEERDGALHDVLDGDDHLLLGSSDHDIENVLDALRDAIRLQYAPVAYGRTTGWSK